MKELNAYTKPTLIDQLVLLLRLRRNLRSEPSRIEQIQKKKLVSIVKYAYENIPFYNRKFKAAGFKPYDIMSSADFTKIPLTTKSEIQASPLGDVVSPQTDFGKCIKRTTSGSTGIPLTMYVSREGCTYDSVVWYRTLIENGLRVSDKIAFLRNPRDLPKKESWLNRIGLTRRRYISTSCPSEMQLSFLKKFRPDVIRSTPSALELLAMEHKHGVAEINPRLIFTGAELVDYETRKLIHDSYNADVFDNYASEEFSLMAWECKEHSSYHINSDNVLLELIDEDETVSSGERGEIVCTSLNNYAMPLIRYRIGDIGVFSQELCSCGVTLPLMKCVEGRKDDFLITSDMKLVGPLARQIFDHSFRNIEGMMQYRVIQEKRDKLTIQLVVRDSPRSNDKVFEKVEEELRKIFGEDTQFEFQFMNELNRDPSGKKRKFISRIPRRY